MTRYSKQSQRLAHKVAQRASSNLARSGKSVKRSATTGRYVVISKDGRARSTTTERTGN